MYIRIHICIYTRRKAKYASGVCLEFVSTTARDRAICIFWTWIICRDCPTRTLHLYFHLSRINLIFFRKVHVKSFEHNLLRSIFDFVDVEMIRSNFRNSRHLSSREIETPLVEKKTKKKGGTRAFL